LFLERIRRLGQVEYSDAAFQSLKTFGFDLIRSDSLRFELINLFDNEYEHHKNLNNAADLARYNALNNYYDQYFSYEDNGIVPNDYYTVINDQTFYNKLTLRKDWKKYVVSICNSIMEQSKNLKSHIHDELKLINK
jgi:hypothetical protein